MRPKALAARGNAAKSSCSRVERERTSQRESDTLTKPQLGANAAYDNWRCFVGTRDAPTSLHPLSMEQACKFQYGHAAIETHPTNPDDAYTWVCYSVAHGVAIPADCYEPRPRPPVGACRMCLCVVVPGSSDS